MKHLLLLYFSILTIYVLPAQTTLAEQSLRGPVEMVIESTHQALVQGGVVNPGQLTLRQSDTYDAEGNHTERKQYAMDGTITSHVAYQYDERGNMVEESWYRPDGSLAGKRTYSYDRADNRTEGRWHEYPSNLSGKLGYEYDSEGRLTVENWFGSAGNVSGQRQYRYIEDEGHEEVHLVFNAQMAVTKRSVYQMDLSGNRLRWEEYRSEDDLAWRYEYAYDDMGRQLEYLTFGSDGAFTGRFTYGYDMDGNISRTNYFNQTGELVHATEFRYDDTDLQGNWLKRVSIRSKIPVQVTLRIVSYHP